MIDPQAASVLKELESRAAAQPDPENAAGRLANARAMTDGIADFSGAPPAEIQASEIEAPGPRGPIALRMYRPTQKAGLPVLVWYHGGGAMAGSIQSHDVPLRQLSAATGWAIVSVGYRLGPEHPYPAAHEDCYAATLDVATRAERLGLDPARLVVGGDSIGGLFGTTVARIARDRGGPAVAAQIMLYPNTDLRPDRDHPSLSSEEGNVMTRASMAYENDLYIPVVEDRYSTLASPLLSADLAGLPPALLVTCERDPLRDEGEAYLERLREAGVRVEHRRYEGMIHAFFQMAGRVDAAHGLIRDIAAYLDDLPR